MCRFRANALGIITFVIEQVRSIVVQDWNPIGRRSFLDGGLFFRQALFTSKLLTTQSASCVLTNKHAFTWLFPYGLRSWWLIRVTVSLGPWLSFGSMEHRRWPQAGQGKKALRLDSSFQYNAPATTRVLKYGERPRYDPLRHSRPGCVCTVHTVQFRHYYLNDLRLRLHHIFRSVKCHWLRKFRSFFLSFYSATFTGPCESWNRRKKGPIAADAGLQESAPEFARSQHSNHVSCHTFRPISSSFFLTNEPQEFSCYSLLFLFLHHTRR